MTFFVFFYCLKTVVFGSCAFSLFFGCHITSSSAIIKTVDYSSSVTIDEEDQNNAIKEEEEDQSQILRVCFEVASSFQLLHRFDYQRHFDEKEEGLIATENRGCFASAEILKSKLSLRCRLIRSVVACAVNPEPLGRQWSCWTRGL